MPGKDCGIEGTSKDTRGATYTDGQTFADIVRHRKNTGSRVGGTVVSV